MTDALMDRIKAHRSAPDVYDPPTFDQMANYIQELTLQLLATHRQAADALDKRTKAGIVALEAILNERGPVFDAMVDAAEDAAGKDVSFNVVVGRAIRAALAELQGEK